MSDRKGRCQSKGEANGDLGETASHYQKKNVAHGSTKRDAYADLLSTAAGSVGDHGVDPNGRHQHCDKGESQEDLSKDAQKPDLISDCVPEAKRFIERQLWVEALHGLTHGRQRIGGGLGYQCHVVPAHLAIGDKQQGLGIIPLQILHHVGGDANYGDPWGGAVLVVEETKLLANWILCGPETSGGIAA